jgi:hypothetical protein
VELIRTLGTPTDMSISALSDTSGHLNQALQEAVDSGGHER